MEEILEDKKKRQVTLFVDADLLEEVDARAYAIRKRKTDRTTWIIRALEEKLERDTALAESTGEPADEGRIREIVNTYAGMPERGKEWLYDAARAAGAWEGFAD